MLTVGHGRGAEAGTSPRQLMGKASPRGAGGTRHSFSRVSNNKYGETVAEGRQGHPLLRPPNSAVEATKLDISPPAMQPLSRAGYARHDTRVGAAATTTPRGGGAAEAARRGRPLAEWVWPSNESASSIAVTGESLEGAAAVVNSDQKTVSPASLDEPLSVKGLVSAVEIGAPKRPIITQQQQQARPSIVVGKVCEPIRPTRLDLSSVSEGACWFLDFLPEPVLRAREIVCCTRDTLCIFSPVFFPEALCANS